MEQKQQQLMISEAQNATSGYPHNTAAQQRIQLLEETFIEEKSILNAELNALNQQRLASHNVQTKLYQQTTSARHLKIQEENAIEQAKFLTEQEQELSKKIRSSKTVLRTAAMSDGRDNWPSNLFSSLKFILETNDEEPERCINHEDEEEEEKQRRLISELHLQQLITLQQKTENSGNTHED